MINKSFHNVLKGVSILPALLVVPAMADPMVGFVDGYVTETMNQLYDVLDAQNKTATGFNVGKITIGTDTNPIRDNSLRYGVTSRNNATQYVRVENATLPTGFGDISLNMPLYDSNTEYGLDPFEISMMESVLKTDVEIDQDNNVAKPRVADAVNLLNSMINANIIHERTWVLDVLNSAISSGALSDGYLYTNNNFVVDGHYGNMAVTLIETYRDAIEGMLDELANVDGMTQQQVADKMAIKLGRVALKAKNGVIPDDDSAKMAGEMIFKGAFGITTDDVAAKWKSGELETTLSNYLTQIETKLAGLDSLKMTVGEVVMNGGNVTFQNNVNLTSDNVAINAGNVTVDTGAQLTLGGANLRIADGAVLANNGTLNVNSTNVTLNENLIGNGTLVIGENTSVTVGDANITQNTITLNGNMSAVLREEDGARFNASTFGGNGTLNASFAGAGEYQIFSTDVTFADDNIVNSVYDITNLGGGRYDVAVKSAAKIASDNNLSAEAAATVGGLAGSSSNALNDLSVLMQEKLAENTAEARQEIEQATSAINPETESVAQSVSNSVQTTVVNLASARMVAPVAGRSAGDVDLKAGGVWAQGLYNKSKLNDAFNGYTRGVAVGADGIINNDITVGAGYAFNHSDITSNSRNTEIDSNTVFVYGQYKPAEWYVNAILNYTWSEYSEDGTAMGMPVTGEYNADSFGAAVAGGYDFACGVTPELGLRYMHINGDSYTDSLGINKEFDSTNYLTGTLGARYGFNVMATETTLLRPELRYAIKYDLVSDASYATVAMPGVAAYSVDGNRLERFGNEFGIGLTMRYRTMDLSLTYDIDVRKDYTSQTGMLKFRYNF